MINAEGRNFGWGRAGDATRAIVKTSQSPSRLDAEPCAGVAEWNAAMEPIMIAFFDALEPMDLLQENAHLTHDEWRSVRDASKKAERTLATLTPPPAREAWHDAQLQMVVAFGYLARVHLDEGNNVSEPDFLTWTTIIIDMDRAIASSPRCPPTGQELPHTRGRR